MYKTKEEKAKAFLDAFEEFLGIKPKTITTTKKKRNDGSNKK